MELNNGNATFNNPNFIPLLMNIDKDLDEVVNFIKSSFKSSDKILDTDGENEIQFDCKIEPNLFETFNLVDGNIKIGAVDGGSSIILNASSFIIGVYQTGYSILKNNKKKEDEIPKLKLKIISNMNKNDIYFKEYLNITGEFPKKPAPDIGWVLQRLRIFDEWNKVNELIEKFEKGDIIIFDGSLKADIGLPDIILDKITKKAHEKGIILVGISKRSSLHSNHVPITYLVKKLGEKNFPKNRWYFNLKNSSDNHLFGNSYIVKFNPLSKFIFRTDINKKEKASPKKIFGILSNYCNDPSYLGYPYPLAFVHNKVVINSEIQKTVKNKLQYLGIKKGISLQDWESLFLDFHDILDTNF